jgi:hypothetical protein
MFFKQVKTPGKIKWPSVSSKRDKKMELYQKKINSTPAFEFFLNQKTATYQTVKIKQPVHEKWHGFCK